MRYNLKAFGPEELGLRVFNKKNYWEQIRELRKFEELSLNSY